MTDVGTAGAGASLPAEPQPGPAPVRGQGAYRPGLEPRTELRPGLRSALQRRFERWSARLEDSFPGHVGRRSNELNLARECLALAAQQTLCTVPLLVAISALNVRLGLPTVGTIITHYLGLSAGAGLAVRELFVSHARPSDVDVLTSLAIALVFATSVAATSQRAYEKIWYRPRAGLRSTWRQGAWVLGLTAYLVVVFYAGRFGHHAGGRMHAATTAGPVVQLLVSFLFSWWSQRILLGPQVSWRSLLPGAAAMAVGTSVLVLASPLMSAQITGQVQDYGLIGATFVLSVWLLVLSAVLFGGALLGAVYTERRLLAQAGVVGVVPAPAETDTD